MTFRQIVQTTFVTLTAVATLSCGGSPDRYAVELRRGRPSGGCGGFDRANPA